MKRLLFNVRSKVREFVNWCKDLRNTRAKLTLKVAIEKAEDAHLRYGVRYWVIPTPEGQLAVMNWNEARDWREIGILPKAMKVGGLYNIAIYWTAASSKVTNKMHGMSLPKQGINYEKYYGWWEMTHKS